MDQLIEIGLLILGLLICWTVLRFMLRLTMRLFTLGCALVVILGVVLLLIANWR